MGKLKQFARTSYTSGPGENNVFETDYSKSFKVRYSAAKMENRAITTVK